MHRQSLDLAELRHYIFTSSKQPWVMLPPDTPAVAEYYDRSERRPKESLERRRVLLAGLDRD